MAELSIMILCGPSPRHIYVANRLCQAARPVAVVQEVGTHWTKQKIIKLLRSADFYRKASRWVRDRRRYTGNQEARFFFGSEQPAFDREELVVQIPYINHPRVAELAARHKPDLITVFGTTLIRPPLLGMGRLGMVNLHGGLSPQYRGADCTFWALYNGEPEKIGCTLHHIDPGIDTGSLIAHICPEVHPEDDELTLFWRAVKDGAEIYVDLVARMERGELFGQSQPAKGKLYRVKDRLRHHERELAKRLKNNPIVPEPLPGRVKWFTTDMVSAPE